MCGTDSEFIVNLLKIREKEGDFIMNARKSYLIQNQFTKKIISEFKVESRKNNEFIVISRK